MLLFLLVYKTCHLAFYHNDTYPNFTRRQNNANKMIQHLFLIKVVNLFEDSISGLIKRHFIRSHYLFDILFPYFLYQDCLFIIGQLVNWSTISPIYKIHILHHIQVNLNHFDVLKCQIK